MGIAHKSCDGNLEAKIEEIKWDQFGFFLLRNFFAIEIYKYRFK